MTARSVLSYAMLYHERGLAVFPLRPREKKPHAELLKARGYVREDGVGSQKPIYDGRFPSKDDIEYWFRDNEINIAIACGKVSGNLIVIDFDSEELFKEWYDRVNKEYPDLRDMVLNTWIIETGKGIHVYFRLKDSSLVPRTKVKVEGKPIDIKGEGGYVVAPPSIHPNGKTYSFRCGSPNSEIVVIEDRKLWKELLRTLGIGEEENKEKEFVREGARFRTLGDSALIKLKELLKEAWVEGQRQTLALFLSGWFAKAGIHPVSTARLFLMIGEERQDNEIEERLSTIYYSYRKHCGEIPELRDLDEYIEKLKSDGLIRRSVSKAVSRGVEERVKGKSGVQEILNSTLGEERALDIIRQIEDVIGYASPYRDPTTILTDHDKGLGYMNHPKLLRIYRIRREDGRIELLKLVWEGAITKLTMYVSPLDALTKFEIVWESRVRPKPLRIGPATLDEIFERLRSEGFLSNSRLGKDALNNVVNALISKKKAEIKTEIENPGFYIVDNKIVAVKWKPKDITREELKEALELLNELATKWYVHVIDKFATSVKWGIISPFIYARKQLGRRYQVPHLVMYGARNTGKTTLAEICTMRLWGLDKSTHSYSGSQANTEARLGRVVSNDTFPRIINEANSMFYRPEVINILKNTVEELIARGKYVRNAYLNVLALSPLIITLNPSPPVDFEGLGLVPKTIWLLYFTEGERLKQEQIESFRKDVEPRLHKLEAIGHYAARVILERGPEILKKDWRELGEELLVKAYEEVGLTPPEWIRKEYEVESFEDIERDKIERIRSKFIKYINEQYSRNIGKIIANYEIDERMEKINIEDVSIEDKLNILLKNKLIPFMIMKKDKVYITSSILRELRIEIDSLRSLADLLGWIYRKSKSFRFGNKTTSLSVIETTIEELQAFLEFEAIED